MMNNETTISVIKKHIWPILAILFYFLSIAAIGFKVGIAIGLFEFVFLIIGGISTFRIKSPKSILTGLGLLALLIFLFLIGLSEIVTGLLMSSNIKSTVSSIGLMGLGFLTIVITAFIYKNVLWENQKIRKEKEIEREAYLKKKGELEAEKEGSLSK